MKSKVLKVIFLTLLINSAARLAMASSPSSEIDQINQIEMNPPLQAAQPADTGHLSLQVADPVQVVDGCTDDKCQIPICHPINGCVTPSNNPPLQIMQPSVVTCVNPDGCAPAATTPDTNEDAGENIVTEPAPDTSTGSTGTSGSTGTVDDSAYYGTAAIAGGACSLNLAGDLSGFDAGFVSMALLAGLNWFRRKK